MPDDILTALPPETVATHRKLRWSQISIFNDESVETTHLVAHAVTIPVRLDENGAAVRVPGSTEPAPDRRVVVPFNPSNPLHLQVYSLLEQLVLEADTARQAMVST